MIRFFSLFSFIFCVAVASNAAALEPCAKDYTPIEQRYQKGVAFIVQKCGGLQSVLIGTMHSDDPKLLELHKKALPVLKVARNALFEIKLDNEAIQAILAAMYYNPASGQSLKKDVGEKDFDRFIALAPDKDVANEYLKPWAASILLQYPKKVADGIVLDHKLQNMATQQRVNVAGLEKAEEQFAIFESMTKEEQIQALQDALDNYDMNIRMQDRLVAAYTAKDLKAVEALLPESMALMADKEAAERFMKLFVEDRNVKMADRLVPYLETGNSFAAVGALHLPGKMGMLKLLEDKGYKIEVLY